MAAHSYASLATDALRQYPWLTTILTILSPIIITYLISLWNSSTTIRKLTDPRRPPTAPYYIPYIGHAIAMTTKPFELYETNLKRFGRDGLWKLCLPGIDSYQVFRPDHVAKVFRSQGMEMSESHARSLENSFGMPSQAASLYERDDSGYGPQIAEGSKVKPNERILLTQHDFTARHRSGDSLTSIVKHYQHFLVQGFIETLDSLGDDWVEIPDLSDFLRNHITKAAVLSMYGPHIIRLNPDIVQDIWAFIPYVMTLFMGPPKWLMPSIFRLREKLLDGIEAHYKHAQDHYKANGADQDWEEFYGSSFMRKKYLELWEQFDPIDSRASAAEDLSFLWASNANSAEAVVWSILEVLQDPELLHRVRTEADESRDPPGSNDSAALFDLEKLCSMPVSQAVYAEVLRVRVSVLIVRKAKHNLDFAGWSIKKGERVAAISLTRARDDQIWNTGTTEEPHSLDEFWADRFLIYPDNPQSGPLRNPSVKRTEQIDDEKANEGPRFSMTGLTNSWIPYSGGARLCPGRHFAKREMIVTTATAVSLLDIELMTPQGWKPQPDASTFGGGTMPVKGKIPCRIRRRRQG